MFMLPQLGPFGKIEREIAGGDDRAAGTLTLSFAFAGNSHDIEICWGPKVTEGTLFSLFKDTVDPCMPEAVIKSAPELDAALRPRCEVHVKSQPRPRGVGHGHTIGVLLTDEQIEWGDI